ncbi:hypothetical protein D9M71_357550 [compost metagenome]
MRTGGVRVEVVDGPGQAGERANRHAYREPGAEQQQRKLQDQDQRQPAGHRDGPRGDVHRQRAAVAQRQARLEVGGRSGNVLETQGVALANRPLDGDRGHMGLLHVHGRAGLAVIQPIAIVAPLQQRKPGGALVGWQAIDQRHGGAHVMLQVAEHQIAPGLVALVELRGEGQPVGQYQAGKKDQRQAGAEGTWPPHVNGSISWTGRAKT